MTGTVEGAGVELAYSERGQGPALLLVHGMADDSSGWDDLAGVLLAQARVIAYDRRGYGGSGAPETYERTTVEEQAEDAAALLKSLDAAPAVVCGRDFGALVCLDLILRHRDLVIAAAVIEPSVFPLAPSANQALSEQRLRLQDALRDGGPEAAVSAFLAGSGATVDARRLGRARADHRAFFADYGGIAGWPVTRRDLRSIAAPVAVLGDERAPAYVREATEAVAELIPGARGASVAELEAVLRDLLAGSS